MLINKLNGGAPASAASPVVSESSVAQALPPIDPHKISLTTPLQTHKGMLYELNLRQPCAADYIEIGKVPFDVRGNEEDRRAVIDFKIAAQWLSRLTEIDEIIIGKLTDRDWLLCVARINVLLMRGGAVGN
jgi:hypothetical protein